MKNLAMLILDASGSMAGHTTRLIGGVNEYMASLKSNGAKCELSVWIFDSDRWEEIRRCKLKDWVDITAEDYRAGALTPLCDAVARGIAAAEAMNPKRCSFIIDTDGYENYSQEHTRSSVRALVDAKKKEGWDFEFIGTGTLEEDAQAISLQGAVLGMSVTASTHENRGSTYSDVGVRKAGFFQD